MENFKQKITERHPRAAMILIVAAFTIIFTIAVSFYKFNKVKIVKAESEATTTPYNLLEDTSIVAMIGGTSTIVGNIVLNNSWPGEIISSEISHIQPQREGVITEWRVRIGDNVSAGEVLGKISAAPATPELIEMLAEQAQMASQTKANAIIADEFASKEKERLEALKYALDGKAISSSDLSFKALDGMRKKLESKKDILRSFIERTLSNHVYVLFNLADWRYSRLGTLNAQFGIYSQQLQNDYQISLVRLIDKLKNSSDIPIDDADVYFSLAVKLAANSNNSSDYPSIEEFKMTTAEDQEEFLDMLSDYRMAQADIADEETEYKIMINEGISMVEKDRSMAQAEADAAAVAYDTVARAINGGTYILSPRAGTVSAIYKKVGELVDPTMPIAVIAGYGKDSITVRMRIPNNIRKPIKGELLSVVRPGFLRDVYKAKMIGVGTALDDTGSYMADAVLIDSVDWPSGASVRVIPSQDSNVPIISLSSVWWTDENTPNVWSVSEAGRISANRITIGRTIGTSVEVYDGLKDGDHYLISPTPNLKENMLLEDILPKDSFGNSSAKSGGKKPMGGMEM